MAAHDHLRVAWKAAFEDLRAQGKGLGLTDEEIEEILGECKPKGKRGPKVKAEDDARVDDILLTLKWGDNHGRFLSKSAVALAVAELYGRKRGNPETYRITLLRKVNARLKEASARAQELFETDEQRFRAAHPDYDAAMEYLAQREAWLRAEFPEYRKRCEESEDKYEHKYSEAALIEAAAPGRNWLDQIERTYNDAIEFGFKPKYGG